MKESRVFVDRANEANTLRFARWIVVVSTARIVHGISTARSIRCSSIATIFAPSMGGETNGISSFFRPRGHDGRCNIDRRVSSKPKTNLERAVNVFGVFLARVATPGTVYDTGVVARGARPSHLPRPLVIYFVILSAVVRSARRNVIGLQPLLRERGPPSLVSLFLIGT